jgi:ATP-binding cassette, subfamily B, bacterial
MDANLEELTWPASRLGDALLALVRAAGLPARAVDLPEPPKHLDESDDLALGRWIEGAVGWLGLEAEPVQAAYAEVELFVRGAGPAIVQLPGNSLRFLALLRSSRDSAFVLDPERIAREVPVESIRAALCGDLEAQPTLERVMNMAGVPLARRYHVAQAILREQVGALPIHGGWMIRARPGASFLRQCRQSGLFRRALVFLGAYALAYALWVLAWWTVGRGAFTGKLEMGWLSAWALLLLTLVPFRLLASSAGGLLAIDLGGLLKQRLLAGALGLEPEEIRHQGAGQLLGRVIESEAVEALAIGGGLLAITSLVELAMAGLVLAAGARGAAHSLYLLGWICATGLVAWLYLRRRRGWTHARIEMTYELVERIVGHRTRLAQEPRDHWHEGEDQMVERYFHRSRELDREQVILTAVIPRGWLLLGLLTLLPVLVEGKAAPVALAVSLGGVLLAQRAFRTLCTGLVQFAGATIAWEQVRQMFDAAKRVELVPPAGFSWKPDPAGEPVLLEAHRLIFQYPDRADPALKGLSLSIRPGERLLVEGSSGSGKSTLASVLAGLRIPSQGLLLLGGLDRPTLGLEGWRRRVVMAPQFHENYVLTGTLGFNLLMGRRWPPRDADLEEAEEVFRALGLGDVLDRMPAGFRQTIGETGWQLSHGEKSRLFIARALLQGADLVLLDESFAALDPETVRRALGYVLSRGHALIVIAHP